MVNFIWENIFQKEGGKLSVRGTLKENILFQDFNPNQLRLLENIVNVRNYRPGETIFRQGEVGVGMYIIMSGRVSVNVEELKDNSNEPVLTHVTQLKKGDFFGELALVEDNGRRSATCIAHEESALIGFFKPDLMELVERNPGAGVRVLLRLGEVLGTRLRETTAKISELKKGSC